MVLRFAQPHVGSRVEVTAHRERRADEDKEQRCVRLGKRWHRLALQERLSRAAAAYCFFLLWLLAMLRRLPTACSPRRARHR